MNQPTQPQGQPQGQPQPQRRWLSRDYILTTLLIAAVIVVIRWVFWPTTPEQPIVPTTAKVTTPADTTETVPADTAKVTVPSLSPQEKSAALADSIDKLLKELEGGEVK